MHPLAWLAAAAAGVVGGASTASAAPAPPAASAAAVNEASTLAVAPAEPGTFAFLTLGDWGSGKRNQTLVAKTMGRFAEAYNPQFVLALGDNVYEYGVQSTADPLWEDRYCSVYTDDGLNVPWYAILGNHDHYGGHPEAEIEYYQQRMDPDGRWVMPDFFYTERWADVGGGKSLEIVFIDTVLLSPNSYEGGFEEEVDAGLVPREHLSRYRESARLLESRRKSAWGWINETLAASDADWLVVAGHFPIYSAGDHGDNAELKEHLRPMLEEHGVDAYLSGHDHVLEYMLDKPEGEGVAYFISGSGGQDVYNLTPTPETVFAVQEAGFMLHTFARDGESMRVQVVQRDGAVLLSVTLPRKRNLGDAGGGSESGSSSSPAATIRRRPRPVTNRLRQ